MKKNNVNYRYAILEDVDNLYELELKVWGKKMAANKEKWISRINIFPEGVSGACMDNQIIGVGVGHIIEWHYDDGDFPTWEEATASGTVKNHNKNGQVLYGVNIAVLHNSPGGVAKMLVKRHNDLAKKLGLFVVMGCRMPYLSKFVKCDSDELTEEALIKYAKQDPEVRFFLGCGFRIIGFKKNYFMVDKKSLGWGAMLVAMKQD